MNKSKQQTWDTLRGLTDLPDYGDLLPIVEFLEMVEECSLIDSDGDGYFATKNGMDRKLPVPTSKLRRGETVPPEWATHVMWFNK